MRLDSPHGVALSISIGFRPFLLDYIIPQIVEVWPQDTRQLLQQRTVKSAEQREVWQPGSKDITDAVDNAVLNIVVASLGLYLLRIEAPRTGGP